MQFTDASYVGSAHAYFEGQPVKNDRVKKFFKLVLNGRRGDKHFAFDPASNTYRVK